MTSMTVVIADEAYEILARLAAEDRRRPRDQASVLLAATLGRIAARRRREAREAQPATT